MIQVGDVLRGRYRIDSSIGRGGMGEVFAAVTIDPSIVYDEAVIPGRRVAVKVVSRRMLGDVLMARLQREAIAAVRVKSDYVPQVLDVDTTEEGEVFLVMELLRGQTLGERLRRRGGSLTWDEIEGIGEDVLRGLIDAHGASVVHRDLKPSNIFIETRRGPAGRERAKILDFGVCKIDSADEERLTTTGESVGTVAYMAPEQVRGASKVDARADLYSFGSVVFEALAGCLPHEGPGQMAMLASKLERHALRLKEVADVAFPPRLDALLAKLLSRRPEDRYTTAREVLEEWTTLGPATTEAPTVPLLRLDAAEPGFPTQTNLTSGTLTRLGRKPSKLGVALGAGAMLLTGVVLVLMASERTAPPVEGLTQFVAVGASSSDPPSASNSPWEETVFVTPSSLPPAQTETASVPVVDLPIQSVDVDAGPAAKQVRTYGRPSVRWTKRPGYTGEPHIADKPRY